VWSTLHTNNAVASIQRLMDMGVPSYLVTDPALTTGIINQSLLPVLCPKCRIPLRENLDTIDHSLRLRLETAGHRRPGQPARRRLLPLQAPGCVDRTVVAEVLLSDLLFMKTFVEKEPARRAVIG
jgi:type II secretory ATPase GspE/PulE/Tfp pilus assembly ATPase PilB-like protein